MKKLLAILIVATGLAGAANAGDFGISLNFGGCGHYPSYRSYSYCAPEPYYYSAPARYYYSAPVVVYGGSYSGRYGGYYSGGHHHSRGYSHHRSHCR